MSFTIPNEASATYPAQAAPDSIDFAMMMDAFAGRGVLSGCAVTAQGTPNMTVAVAAGLVRYGSLSGYVLGGNVTIQAADATSARFDLICADGTTGALLAPTSGATGKGTPAANPVFPAIPANAVVLAAVYVPANATTITSAQIIDKRIVTTGRQVFNAGEYGAIPDAYFTDGVSNATTTFTSATAAFVAADVGKTVVILNAGPSALQDHHTTIASVESGTSVTLTHTTGRTQSSCRFYISRAGDQTTALQNAVNAAGTAGGGIVLLPGVGYLASQLNLKSRVVLQGVGMRATLVHQVHGTNQPLVINDPTANQSGAFIEVRNLWLDGARARQSNITSTLNGAYTAGNSTITLTDASSFLPVGSILIGTNRLTYTSKSGNVLSGVVGGKEASTDANGANGATVTQHAACGIYFATNPYNTFGTTAETYDPHFLVENVLIKNCKGDAIQAWGQSENRWRNVYTDYCDNFGFRPTFDHWMSDCTASNSGRAGYYLFSSEVKMVGCKSFFAGGVTAAEGWGVLIEGPTTIEEGTKTISSLDVQDSKAEGVFMRNAQRVHLTGTLSSNCVSAGSGAGLRIDGCTLGIIDVVCVERAASATQLNAIYLLESGSIANAGLKIRLTHGAAAGAGAVSTAIKSGSVFTGGVDISINGQGSMIAPAFAASYTPDPYVATVINLGALTANLTVNAPSNAHLGAELEFRLVQDGTGGRTVTWNAAYVFNPAYSDIGNTLSKVFRARFRYNGTNWLLVWMSQSATAGTYWA